MFVNQLKNVTRKKLLRNLFDFPNQDVASLRRFGEQLQDGSPQLKCWWTSSKSCFRVMMDVTAGLTGYSVKKVIYPNTILVWIWIPIKVCRLMWYHCVKVRETVVLQSVPAGVAPAGSFYSTQNPSHDFFGMEAEIKRDGMIKEGMSFLHSLVTAKLSNAKSRQESQWTAVATAATEAVQKNQENIQFSGSTQSDMNGKFIKAVESVTYVTHPSLQLIHTFWRRHVDFYSKLNLVMTINLDCWGFVWFFCI